MEIHGGDGDGNAHGKGTVLAATAMEKTRHRHCLRRHGGVNAHGKGTVVAAAAVKPHGKGGVVPAGKRSGGRSSAPARFHCAGFSLQPQTGSQQLPRRDSPPWLAAVRQPQSSLAV